MLMILILPMYDIKLIGAIPTGIEHILKCDCIVLVTNHDQYKNINSEDIKNKIFICTRPILEPQKFKDNGVIFKGIGRINKH